MRSKQLITTLLLALISVFSYSQTDDEWGNDLNFLKEQIGKIVPDANQYNLDNKFNSLKEHFNDLSHIQKVMAIQKLLAELSDEGIRLLPIQSAFDNSILPIKTYLFSDGLYVLDAFEDYKSLKNHKVVAINGIKVEQLYDQLSPYLSGDNENYKKYVFLFYLQSSLWLKGAGILEETDKSVNLTLEGGQTTKVDFGSYDNYSALQRNLIGSEEAEHRSNYWKSYDTDTNTLLIQFQAIADNDTGDSFSKFVSGIEKDLNSKKIDKLIIDNRFGGGGNGFKLKPFTDLIQKSQLNKKGKLFVLISRATRGTVMELSSILELNTKAIFIGEPTGEGPNSVGDTKYIDLPHSKQMISLTHKFWPTSWQSDNRKELKPNVSVAYSFDDHVSRLDPWLEAIKMAEVEQQTLEMPESLLNDLPGKYKVLDYNVVVENRAGGLYLSVKRKIKSFFEINTELHHTEQGVLTTDIEDVKLNYEVGSNGSAALTSLDWKGVDLKVE
ncbi:hypothetical protein [Fulvivirga lutimaris]|uniref:hypothetical protein n=1 Tax=Fulvivirga lutimaris TaxID=1819566 RepID=UPI0012BC6812|nr:hypothetical protein [Fulvivirga lutimaris]MTI38166.1 hypothetical protein [Fulvivirga lutimaris]